MKLAHVQAVVTREPGYEASKCVCVYACVHACLHAHMHVCVYTCAYVHACVTNCVYCRGMRGGNCLV